MASPDPVVRPMTDRPNIDPQEWELRCDLAAAYRLFARFGASSAALCSATAAGSIMGSPDPW